MKEKFYNLGEQNLFNLRREMNNLIGRSQTPGVVIQGMPLGVLQAYGIASGIEFKTTPDGLLYVPLPQTDGTIDEHYLDANGRITKVETEHVLENGKQWTAFLRFQYDEKGRHTVRETNWFIGILERDEYEYFDGRPDIEYTHYRDSNGKRIRTETYELRCLDNYVRSILCSPFEENDNKVTIEKIEKLARANPPIAEMISISIDSDGCTRIHRDKDELLLDSNHLLTHVERPYLIFPGWKKIEDYSYNDEGKVMLKHRRVYRPNGELDSDI